METTFAFEPMASSEEPVEMRLDRQPHGPSSHNCCRVNAGNSCGSGSAVGKRNGKTLVLTNAHVAGTRPGKQVTCFFPFANNGQGRSVSARIVMAGYSDRVMMDWCVLECEDEIDVPHVKLAIGEPKGEHYTGGYPRCQGPYFQTVRTVRFTHKGTVWQWQPDSIGGQSGSGIRSLSNDLQYGLLTWSWGGNGAGQTVRMIWNQYIQRAVFGFERPEGLIELSDKPDGLESGFFLEANITTLPIWAHLDDGDDDGNSDPNPPSPNFVAEVLKRAKKMRDEADSLIDQARKYADDDSEPDEPADPDSDGNDQPPTFGM